MERFLSWGTLALLLCWSLPASAQPGGFDPNGLKFGAATVAKPEFTTTLSPASAKLGDEVTLSIHVKLPKGYYIYGTKGDFGGRTKIETTEVGLKTVDAEFVPDREEVLKREPLFDADLSKFHDEVTWKKRYRIAKDADPSKVSVTGELAGQYCSEGSDETPGNCVPIIPPYGFSVALKDGPSTPENAGAAVQNAVASPRFEYEERPKTKKGKINPALLNYKLSPSDAKPGDRVTLSIRMDIDKCWHTFSLTQDEKGGGGTPTVIALETLNGLKRIGEIKADPAFEVEKPLPDLLLEVHHDHVTWSQEFEVVGGTKPGQYGVKGQITYQTCEKSCLAPREIGFELGVVSQQANAAVVPAGAPGNALGNPRAAQPQDQGLFSFILTAIGFGLVSLLTPCVFPMVPITVSFFLKQSESKHHRPLLVALVFCGSIVATFTILGVGIAAIFGAAQLNALANNPWLNLAIGTVFVVFAFNMLGLFEIRIPSSLLTFTANKEQAGGYLGAMFMALTFTLTSFTCTFAFAGTLLVAAAQGQFYWPIIGMMAFGSAFALPFFLLAIVPSLLKKLPKSGGWMNVVKVVMGLIEIGAAIKFYSVADLVWNPQPVLFDFTFVMIAWLVLSLTIALYLLGVFRLAHDVPPTGISVVRMVLVMAFFGLSCNLAVGLITHERGGGWIMEQIIAFAPPRFENEAAVEKGGPPPTDLPEPVLAHHGVWFTLDVDKGIDHAMKQNRPMLFDFTGVNCVNCRLMEIKMAQPDIHKRLEKLVLVQLYADKVPKISDRLEVKRLLQRNNDLQSEWFGDVSLPAYAVVTPDGKHILSMYKGLERKEGEFAAFLDEGMKKWQEMHGNAPALQVVERP